MAHHTVAVAGSTGELGKLIVTQLQHRGAKVRALVRASSDPGDIEQLRESGAQIQEVDYTSTQSMERACKGAMTVISALSGLEDVIVDTQLALLEAAVSSKVTRFIPSDFAADFTRLPAGENRNFDLRNTFRERARGADIELTSIFNGAFADMLLGQAPFIIFPLRRVLYWGSASQRLDFTTMQDAAAFTAAVALEESSTPRDLHIASFQVNARELAHGVSAATGHRFGLLRAGSLETLSWIIKGVRLVFPGQGEVFPPWQGMQYMHNMYAGKVELGELDNARHDVEFTPLSEVLANRDAAA